MVGVVGTVVVVVTVVVTVAVVTVDEEQAEFGEVRDPVRAEVSREDKPEGKRKVSKCACVSKCVNKSVQVVTSMCV